MKTAVQAIRDALSAGVLVKSLVVLPERGATEAEISSEESILGRRLSAQFRQVLQSWNGANLEVIRILGCGPPAAGFFRISTEQIEELNPEPERTIFAISLGGARFAEFANGRIVRLGYYEEPVVVAEGVDEFFSVFVFGARAAEFSGDEWLEELRGAGLIG